MLNPKLTHSVTHFSTSCSHAAGDRVNLSWLAGIGKPGMPLPCSDTTVFAMHNGFYKKKIISCCKCTFACVSNLSPMLNLQRLVSAMTELEQRFSFQPITSDCQQASCAFRLPAASMLYTTIRFYCVLHFNFVSVLKEDFLF